MSENAAAPRTLAEDAARLAELIEVAGAGGTVPFTGAGVSTESGIPDFRTPGTGLWTQNAPISYQDFMRSAEQRRESWRRGLKTYEAITAAAPNAAHTAIAEWWRDGLVAGVVTQNIDGLHQRAGVPDHAISELHGTSHRVACLTCAESFDRPSINARVEAGDEEPSCIRCGGILKACTISFGQPLDVDVVEQAESLMREARLCLVIGTSLVVYPAAALPELTLERGGGLAIVNNTETHLDRYASLVSRHPAAVLLGEAARTLRGRRNTANAGRQSVLSEPGTRADFTLPG